MRCDTVRSAEGKSDAATRQAPERGRQWKVHAERFGGAYRKFRPAGRHSVICNM